VNSLEPKLWTVLREGYGLRDLRGDLAAGLLVGVVALPLAIAFAIASGVEPERGLITAVVAGFLISALSGSRVQIGGPTGAFIVLVFEIVREFGYDGLAVATLMAGALLVAMGVARLGGLIRYIPYPVTVGFTAGIAVVIASGQIRDALGLDMASVPAEFLPKWAAYAGAIGTLNPWALALTVGTMAVVLGLPRVSPRVPASLVALVAATAVVAVFDLPVDTIGSRFGEVPGGIPMPRLPHIDWAMVPNLVSPALSIALLAAIESLLSAVVADGMTGRRHRSNAELVAQGVANLVTPLFGGIPATGAIARTATNVKAGGRTPVAGMVHALTLLVILVVAGRWAALVPMPVLAGILFVVAYNMSESHLFVRVLRTTTRSDSLVLLSTFGLTVFVDLSVAIQVGVVLASFLFMRRMVEVAGVRSLQLDDDTDAGGRDAEARGSGIEVFEVSGPFFFGAAHKFATSMEGLQRSPRVLVLHLRGVDVLDATGLRVLESMQAEAERGGPALVLSGVHAQPLVVLGRSGMLDRIDEKNLCGDLASARARAREIVGLA
jgi:SulP family sulfate permease